MENELGIPTCLFGGPPAPGDIVKLGESQQGFMSIFASPLFERVSKLLPGMNFSIDELEKNKTVWAERIAKHSTPACNCDVTSNCSCSERKDSRNGSSTTTSIPSSSQTDGPVGTMAPAVRNNHSGAELVNGQTAVAQPLTSTALPLITHAPNEPESLILREATSQSAPCLPRGRSAKTNGSSNGSTTPVPAMASTTAASSPVPHQRAVSAHHPRRKHCTSSEAPMPNGGNPNFASSETDVRYLGNGGAHGTPNASQKGMILSRDSNDDMHSDEILSIEHDLPNGGSARKNKRFAQGIKKLWKRRFPSRSSQTDLRQSSEGNIT
jgi:hypothetical protein